MTKQQLVDTLGQGTLAHDLVDEYQDSLTIKELLDVVKVLQELDANGTEIETLCAMLEASEFLEIEQRTFYGLVMNESWNSFNLIVDTEEYANECLELELDELLLDDIINTLYSMLDDEKVIKHYIKKNGMIETSYGLLDFLSKD